MTQSQTTIANGGPWGKGLFKGPQTQLGFVPEQQTDFIFTVVGEELGFAGAATLLVLFAIDHVAHLASGPAGPRPARHPDLRRRAGHVRLPGVRERGHDHGHHAGHRHPAAVHVLRRIVDASPASSPSAWCSTSTCTASADRPDESDRRSGQRGVSGNLPEDELDLATARTPAGQGPEAGPLHRVRGRQPEPRPPPRAGVLAADLPRHLRDRAAQPGPADPLRDPQRAAPTRWPSAPTPRGPTSRRAAVARAAAVLGRHPPAGRGLRPAGLQPVGRARLHQPAQLHRPGRRAGAGRRAPPRAPADRGRRPLHLQPRAAGRLRRRGRAGRRRGGRGRDLRGRGRVEGVRPHRGLPRAGAARAWPRSPASTCRRCTRSPTRASTSWPSSPATPTCPSGSRSAPSPTWPTGPTPSASSCRSPRSCTTGSTSRSSGAAPGAAASARPA